MMQYILIYILYSSSLHNYRLRYYMPDLQARGITKIGLVLNCETDAAKTLLDLVDCPSDATNGYGVTLFVDNLGKAGKEFGVGRGWRPDDAEMSPYLKLFGMLFGLGVSHIHIIPLCVLCCTLYIC